jgi:hypothetical protein
MPVQQVLPEDPFNGALYAFPRSGARAVPKRRHDDAVPDERRLMMELPGDRHWLD